MTNWRGFAKHYREGGSSRVLEALCARGVLPGWLFYYHDTGIFRLKNSPKALRTRTAGYEYGVAGKQDARELADASVGSDIAALKPFFEMFFDAGNYCFVARKQREIVGYAWACNSSYTITSDNYQARQLHLVLQPDEVVLSNGFIHPGHRLRGLFPGLIRAAVDSYPTGVSFYTTVARLNDLSAKSHQRLGFSLASNVACCRIGTGPYFWTTREPRGARRWLGWNQPTVQLADLIGDRHRDRSHEERSSSIHGLGVPSPSSQNVADSTPGTARPPVNISDSEAHR